MKEYLCRKCQLTFDESEITSEDEHGRDLCPACCNPVSEEDEI